MDERTIWGKDRMESLILTNIVLVHRFISAPGWFSAEYALARHHHGIVYAIDGCAEYRLSDGSSFLLRKDECLYIPRGQAYTVRCTSEVPFTHMTVNFDLYGNQAIYARIVRRDLTLLPHFEQLFAALVRCWETRHLGYRERCLGMMYEMIYLFRREVQSPPRQHDQRLRPARAYLDDHFCEDFSLELLPDMCALSPTYFRRLFRKVFGESPAEYRCRLRIALAEDLLLSGQYSVSETAQLCGYPDPAYFSRIFKKETGESPSRFGRADRNSHDSEKG